MAFVAFALIASTGAAVASSPSVDFGDISHKGLKDLGPASTGLKLSLELGLIADQQGIANAVKAASNPSSSSYGDYLSLSSLQQKYGATSSRRNAVVGAFKTYGMTATVDVTHLRVSATISIGNAQKLFGTKWHLYATGTSNQAVALPVNTPKLGSGLAGNVDTVSGLRLDVTTHVSGNSSVSRAGQGRAASVAGGTPTRTGTISPGCATTTYPSAVASSAGLFPNQILSAYGIASLQAGGLKGQGVRVAILGEAPTPGDDVTAYRNCFGFQGTTLKIHGGSGITPILESSLDAMTLAMVAPKLARLDLWVKAARPERSSGRARAAGRAAAGHDERHSAAERDLDLLRHLRGERQALQRCAHALQPPAGRDLGAGDHDGCRGGRQRLVVMRARGSVFPARQLRQAEVGLLAGNVALGARSRRHEPHTHPGERDRVLRGVERHEVPLPVRADGRGRGWCQHVRGSPMVAAGDLIAEDLPDGP